MKTKLRFLFVLLTMLWWGADFAWAYNAYEYYRYNNTLYGSNHFTASGSIETYTVSPALSTTMCDGTNRDISVALKIDANQSITFTTSETSNVYIGVYLETASASNININFDNDSKTVGIQAEGAHKIIEISDVSSGSHTISTAGTDVGVYYVRVVESPTTTTGDATIQTYPHTWNFVAGNSNWGTTITPLLTSDWSCWGDTYYAAPYITDNSTVGFNLPVIQGLRFQNPAFRGLDFSYGHLYITGGNIVVPSVPKGMKVIVNANNNGQGGSATITPTNATLVDGGTATVNSSYQNFTFVTSETGDVTLAFSGVASIRSIIVENYSVTFDYTDANGKLLTQIDKPVQGNEVTHIFGANNTIRLTASCADAADDNNSYSTVEFEKGKNRSSVKWDQNAYLTLSSDRAVIKKVVFTLKSNKSEASNISIATGGEHNTSDGTYTWTGESSFVKFKASGGDVNNLASVYVEYVERTPLSRFSPMGSQTTTWEYATGTPGVSRTIIVSPNTTELSAQTTDFEVAFTSNREVIAATVGTNPTIDGTNKERVHFNTGVTRGKPGTADVYYRYKGNGTYSGAMSVVTYTITKADQTLSFADNNAAQTQSYSENGNFNHPATLSVGSGEVTYKSSDTHVATVDNSGVVTFVNSGVTTITATAAETDYYNAATASYTLTVNGTGSVVEDLAWDDSNFPHPSFINYGDHANIRAYTNTSGKTVKYRSSDESVATVSIIRYDIGGTTYDVCQITPVAKGTVTITAYVEGEGNLNPATLTTSSITIHGTTFGVQFRSAKGKVTVGKTITPYVKVPNGRWSDFSVVTVSTGDETIATVSAGQNTSYTNAVELKTDNGGISELGGDLKAIYPTIYGVKEGTTTITLTLVSTKYETTTITYEIQVVSDDQHFNWAKVGNNANPIMAYTIYTGDYMMVPAISGNANGNWDYSKGTKCEEKEAYLYGMQAGTPIWNYADFKVGGGYPNYRLTESNTAFTAEQKTSMTNQTDKAYIVWASSQNTSNDTLMIYANKPGIVYLHAFDAQTGSELTPITITILDKSTLAENMENYVESMTYPYTWDFTKDITVTATPNYWEPHYNSSGTLDYYICGYSTMFNWDYCDQDNNGNMNEALGNVEISSPYNKFFIGANSDTGMDGIMPQFYGLTIYSGNSGDTRTKSYESKTDKLRYDHDAGDGNAHLHVVGGIHYLRLPNPSSFIEGENNFKLIIKAKPTGGECTLYKFKNGDHGTSGSGTATWKEITGETPSIVMFDVEVSEMTGDNYIELGIDNVDIYWIAMSTEAKAINPASGATGNSIEMMATYSYDKAMDYSKSSEANGVDAYVATNVSIPAAAANPAITVTLTKANTSVPTGTGVVLRTWDKATSTMHKFESEELVNNADENGKTNSGNPKNYFINENTLFDGLLIKGNSNGMVKVETGTFRVGDNVYEKRLNFLGGGQDLSDNTKTLGRRYVSFNVSGSTKITIECEPEDVSKGNELRVAYGSDQTHLAGTVETFTLESGAKSYTCNYNGGQTNIYIFGTKDVPSPEKTGDGFGIRLYNVTIGKQSATAYMIADAQNKETYATPSEPTINLLKGTSSGITIYQSAGNEICTTSGDSYIPFLFSSKYIYSETGETVHNAGYFSFWRVHGTSTTVGGNKAYLVLPTASYERVAEAWGKAADISGNMVDAASSRGISIRFTDSDEIIDDDNTTTIETVETNGVQDNDLQQDGGYYYNLKGMRTKRPYRGLYIINGKKIMVK